ncbi:hypothetical protein CHUAL_012680 [Chamberlinius hualienensis]
MAMGSLRADLFIGYNGINQPFYYSDIPLSIPVAPVDNLQQTSATDLSLNPSKIYYNFSESDIDSEEFDFEDDDDEDYIDEEEEQLDNTPTKLLNFANVVTYDIRAMFERNKGNEDFCDVYEERFGTTLSGQELYYADLLELANSSSSRTSRKQTKSSHNSRSSASSAQCSPIPMISTAVNTIYDGECSHQVTFSGRFISAYGLGPLEELFKRTFDHQTTHKVNKLSPLPMTMRKLPNSFWQEPGIHLKNQIDSVDFTDLFTQWNNDKC